MLYPSDLEKKIGFDKVRELTTAYCKTRLGKELASISPFLTDFHEIHKQLTYVQEFASILTEGLAFPTYVFFDIQPLLEKARPAGAFLSAEEFHELKLALRNLEESIYFFKKYREQFPYLSGLLEGSDLDLSLVKEINRVIDDSGKVKDTASNELNLIRYSLQSAAKKLRATIDKILRKSISAGYTEEDQQFTLRSGRLVIPVKAEYKRTLKGFIHDESASGQTVFIEPAEVLEANNELRDLELAERREVIRILTLLTDKMRPFIPSFHEAFNLLGFYDFIKAKAELGTSLRCILPELRKHPFLRWINAIHPLLYIHHTSQGKKTVPFSLALNDEGRILIISGPNAGGKSVTLKAVALLQYMLQCGYLIPVSEGSISGVFQDIFIDIGDEQSIENDLSTYSSHLQNLKNFLFYARKSSLIFIDEFGSGTEPQAGGAIAESVLESFNEKGVFGVITTHFANLKKMASETSGIFNGAMLYDGQNLAPLFELETGRAGSSYAFEIAEKAGLPSEVIHQAKSKAGETHVVFEDLTRELEEEKHKLRIKNAEAEKLTEQLDLLKEELASRRQFLDAHKKDLMREAKQAARGLLDEANQKIEKVIREIKEAGAEKERTKTIRNELENLRKKVSQPDKIVKEEVQKESGEIYAGDFVQIIGQDVVGEVSFVKGKEAEVVVGDLKTKIKINRLQKISRKAYKKISPSPASSVSISLREKHKDFSPDLDIRGKRGEEAVYEVQQMLDKAFIIGAPMLRIVHGKGNGILRTLVRDHLKGYHQILSLSDEHADRGGAGVTVVKLK